jgi:hypothetical protein
LFLSRAFKVFFIALAVIGFSTVTYAYAAANVVLASKAGDGRGTINGYSVSPTSIYYNLNADNPKNIDSVTFSTTTDIKNGSTVRIKLVSAGSTWYACTVTGGTNVSCTTSGATVATADSLRFVIAD